MDMNIYKSIDLYISVFISLYVIYIASFKYQNTSIFVGIKTVIRYLKI